METLDEYPDIPPLDIEALGTLDEALERADEMGTHYARIAENIIGQFESFALTPPSMAWLSLVARFQGLHDGIGREIRAENPHAVYPLLRSFIETVAMIIYLADHPDYVMTLHQPRQERTGRRVTARTLVDYATPRMPGIDPIYKQLSQVTHFDTIAYTLPFKVTDMTERNMDWQSHPTWKKDRDALVACGWIIELAEASHHLLVEYAAQHLSEHDENSER